MEVEQFYQRMDGTIYRASMRCEEIIMRVRVTENGAMFEYLITRENECDGVIVGSIDLTIDFKVMDWGRFARIRYDENDHPAEGPEIQVTAVWMEPAGNNVWVRASKEHEEWARDWADENVDSLMEEAHR